MNYCLRHSHRPILQQYFAFAPVTERTVNHYEPRLYRSKLSLSHAWSTNLNLVLPRPPQRVLGIKLSAPSPIPILQALHQAGRAFSSLVQCLRSGLQWQCDHSA
jgi:hypothetical protein